jgi:hypothetical protein
LAARLIALQVKMLSDKKCAMEEDEYPFSSDYENPDFQPYWLAIGKLSATWALFEFTLNDIIWELANLSPKAGTCLTAQLIGPGPRFRCLVALLHLRASSKQVINDANEISGDADKLSRQRNRYVHDPVVFRPADKSFHTMETTADRKVKHSIVPMEIPAVVVLTNKVAKLQKDIEALHTKILDETPPWPRTEYAQSQGIRRLRQGTDSSAEEL